MRAERAREVAELARAESERAREEAAKTRSELEAQSKVIREMQRHAASLRPDWQPSSPPDDVKEPKRDDG